ncbi:5'-nucleotidase C-terminal domain-containing protein [Rhizobiaceae bacterium]|nr:5'-nucleotidase C-terminal domain-containing protein [Rhizobiaceae bacterium]
MPSTLTRLLAATALAATFSTTALAEIINVTLITASDMDTMSGKERGGVARLASVVKAERAKGGNSVFVFPGDLLSPSILAGFDKGEHMIDLLNMTPPDILVPGNHEYDFGPEVFIQRMNEGTFDKLATNTRGADGQPIEGFQDTKMMSFGDLKIGFMGMTTADTPTISSPGPITFAPVVETAKAADAKLREEGADVTVAVVHTAQAIDFDLLYQSGVDIVLSGHDHNLHVFYDGRRALVESKEEAEYVVMMDIAFDVTNDDGERRVRWWPNFRITDTATVEPDAEVAAAVQAYEDTLSKELDIELGKAAFELDTRRISVRTGENAFGNLVADAMRAAVDADIAMTNGGGIRGNIQHDAGKTWTRRDVLTELPFGNGTVKLEVTGAIIRAALEHGLMSAPEAAGSFPHFSGMVVTADLAQPAGSRVTEVMVDGAALDDAKTYTLATNDFMGGGGDGYAMFRDGTVLIDKDSAKLMANDVMAYFRAGEELETQIDGRLKIK